MTTIYVAAFLKEFSESEFNNHEKQMWEAFENIIPVDPDNTEIKSSLNIVRNIYPNIWRINSHAFSAILEMPGAKLLRGDCPSCGCESICPKTSDIYVCNHCGQRVRVSDSRIVRASGDCFVATAVYNDYDHPNVVTLRQFRDRVLVRYSLGRVMIRWYYRYGLSMARRVQSKPKLAATIRKLLHVFIKTFKSHSNHA